MAYFEDLMPCDYFPWRGLTAVGWLEPNRSFEQGPVSEQFVDALRRLLAFPWFPLHFAGGHHCGFCEVFYSHRNLIVPDGSDFFVCPEMILHYIEDHQYRPPTRFQDAVFACPATHSEAYFNLLKDSEFLAECEKMCPNLRSYHAEASQKFLARNSAGGNQTF